MPRFAGGGRYRPQRLSQAQLADEIKTLEERVAAHPSTGRLPQHDTRSRRTVVINNRKFTIFADEGDNGFSPSARDEATGRDVYLGGEDDEDDPTPDAALDRGELYLRRLTEQDEEDD